MNRTRSRMSLAALLVAMLTLFPSLSFAAATVIGPVYAQRDTTVVNFPLTTVSSATQALYSGATFPAGECKVSKDGGTFANCTNTPSEIATTSGVYRLTLSSAEMTADNVVVKISKGSAYEDLVVVVKTKMEAARVSIYTTEASVDAVKIEQAGTDDSTAALRIVRTNGSGAGSAFKITCATLTDCNAISAEGSAGGGGLKLLGGNDGSSTSVGLYVRGYNGGNGAYFSAFSGNADGILIEGSGTGSGLKTTGGATGSGIAAAGGSTSGSGILVAATGGNSIGFSATGFGTGAGMSLTGGSGASTGLATSGATGASFTSVAANGIGLSITGTGTGSGFKAVSGTGYAMELTTGGSAGLYAAGATHGIQGSPDIYPVTLGTSVWAEVSGTEPSAGPTWGASTYGQFLSMLTARFYNKVTQTATAQTVYKTGGSVVMATGTVSDDGVTQTKGQMR